MPAQLRTIWAPASSGTVRAATQALPTIESSTGILRLLVRSYVARPAAADDEATSRGLLERQPPTDVLEQLIAHDRGPGLRHIDLCSTGIDRDSAPPPCV